MCMILVFWDNLNLFQIFTNPSYSELTYLIIIIINGGNMPEGDSYHGHHHPHHHPYCDHHSHQCPSIIIRGGSYICAAGGFWAGVQRNGSQVMDVSAKKLRPKMWTVHCTTAANNLQPSRICIATQSCKNVTGLSVCVKKWPKANQNGYF